MEILPWCASATCLEIASPRPVPFSFVVKNGWKILASCSLEIDNLVFKQEINFIREQASERSYENIEKILEALEKTKVRLRANVNLELALELLFLTIREK